MQKTVAFLYPNSKVMSEKEIYKTTAFTKKKIKNNKILRNKFNQRHEKPVH